MSRRLTTGAFLLPLAFLVDNCSWISPKYLLLGTLSVYCILAGLAAVSMNGIFLDVMMGFAGIACAAHIPTAVSILSSVYPIPSRRKNIVFALFLTGSNPLGIIFGGVGSGLSAMRFTWRAAFCFLAAVFVIIVILGFWAIPNISRTGENGLQCEKGPADPESLVPASQKELTMKSFDWAAFFFLVVGVTLLTSGLTIAPEVGWTTPYVWLILAIGFLALVGLIIWENLYISPMVPPLVWRDKTLLLVSDLPR